MPQTQSKSTNLSKFEAEWKRFHQENFALDEVPPGWISIKGYAQINSISIPAATGCLKKLGINGRAEAKIFRVLSNGIRRRVVYYKLKARKP